MRTSPSRASSPEDEHDDALAELARRQKANPPRLLDLYPPNSDPQRLFIESEADIAIIGGSAGGGKTVAELLEPTQDVNNPGFGAVIFRRTMKQVKDEGGIWDQSATLYPLVGAEANLTERFWRFPSGAVIQFAGLENDLSKYTWKGAQICDILFDELTEFLESQFFYLLSRNRSTCGAKIRMRGSTNPQPGWVKRLLAPWVDGLFPDPAKSGELRWFIRQHDQIVWVPKPPEREPCAKGPDGEGCFEEGCESCFPPEKSITFIRATVYDNRDLLKTNPGYIGNLKAQDDVEMRRLLLGDWDARPAHLLINKFDETRHVVSWRHLDPKLYRFYIGGDFGPHNFAEVFVAEELNNGHLTVYAEDWPGHSRDWDALKSDIHRIGIHRLTDGAGGNRTGEQGWRQACRQMGIPMSEPALEYADPKLQYACLNNAFGAGDLDVFEGCTKLIDMLGRLMRKIDPKTGDITDDFDDSSFHLCAALRYIITMLRPPEPKATTVATFVPNAPATNHEQSRRSNWDLSGHAKR